MAEAVHKTGNTVLIDKYAQKTALRLGVSADAVRAEFKKAMRPGTRAPAAAEETATAEPPAETPRPSVQEYWLLKLLLLHEDLAGWCATHIDLNWLQHETARRLVLKRMELHRNHAWNTLTAFLDECETPEMRSLIAEAATEERPIPNPSQQLADVASRLRNQFIDRELMSLTRRANQPDVDDASRVELLRQQQELRQLKRQTLPLPA
jgi:hypothetical protein